MKSTCPAHAGLRKDGQEKIQLRFKQGLLVMPVEASYHFLREEYKPQSEAYVWYILHSQLTILILKLMLYCKLCNSHHCGFRHFQSIMCEES